MKKWIVLLLLAGCAHTSDSSKDPYLWLEDVEGKEALEWVKAQNEQTLQNLAQSPEFKKVEEQTLQILEAKDKIPAVSFIGSRKLLNFWRDDKSVRGVLRVTSYDNYKKKNVPWDVVLDLDRVAAEEKENWIFKGIDCVAPQFEQCFVLLSRGGKDAVVLREYNIKTKQFNAKGFTLPESKMYVTWADKDHLLVGTDYGPGTMTESGYPRIVKLWKRGTPLDSAKMIYEGAMTDVWARPIAVDQGKKRVLLVSRGIDFFNTEDFVVDVKTASYKKIPKPTDAEFEGYFADQFLYSVKSPWNIAGTTYNSGDVIGLKEAVAGKEVGPQDILKIFTPTPNQSVTSIAVNKSKIILSVLEDVKGKLFTTTYSNNQWQPVIPMQFPGTGSLNAITDTETDIILVNYESFNQPSTLYGIDYGKKAEVLKTLPDRFDAKDVVVEQKFSTSKDGTKIPYFLIRKKTVAFNGEAPTLLYGYGGFTVSQAPAYNGVVGKLWLERGGVYVVANIRGGGEYGPKWHQAALKENRQKAYDDFISVAEDLIQTKVTSPKHLAIRGGSNGGLLVGAVMTQRPELFGAVLCWVPLLDMMRYSQLLAGASWMGEYGDPKVPTYRRAILKYSPYQNVGNHKNYPPTLIVTSTKDDRVHPGHARKMMAKMKEMKQPVMYYENIEGGHAAGANFKQVARLTALQQMFLEQTVLKK
ncbi:MAG: prolyl oligopeptidase family serine peptidase [Bdellovibrionales bacterium]|nr:prolyl oligopeptidase family serine peptidase [Bdellovibrionales bacterium]